MTIEPTPINHDDICLDGAPDEPMTMDEAIALYDTFVAALREVGHELKQAQQEEQAA